MQGPHSTIAASLMTREELRSSGMSEKEIERAARAGDLVRIRRGWYVLPAIWSSWWPEERHRALICASHHETTGGTGVVSHVSAAVMWGLPLYRIAPTSVHMSNSKGSRSSSTGVVTRHDQQLQDEDIVHLDGIPCTSLERTVLDTVGEVSAEAAISIADAAARLVSLRERRIDLDAQSEWRSALRRGLSRRPGSAGIRQARRIIDFADGRAQRPGESVSRLQLRRLGFAAPNLQVEVRGPRDEEWFVDFELEDANAFGEFDGEVKYRDPAMRGGRSVEQVLLDEKRREDWIRGTTQRRFARWGDEHSRTPTLLGRRLAAFGIIPRGR